jgi:peptidoglycan pentaglycine glycine transferase (the second and third glycine)
MFEQEQETNAHLADMIQRPYLEPKERENYLNKKMESDKLLETYKNNLVLATELLKTHPDGIKVAGAMTITFDNAAYVFIDGIKDKYSSLNANYLVKWYMIDDYNKRGFKYINLNAIAGEFEEKHQYSGLNESKLGFNSTITEYIGEFDIILNNFSYNLYKNFKKGK